MKNIILLLAMIVLLWNSIYGQAIPKQISYQGVLKDASGNLVNGDQAMTFKIYNEATGGSALWTEIQAVSVANGLFSVQLGSTNPITTVPFNRIQFLGITVGTGSELLPRTLLSPSPYSFMAMNVMHNTVVKSLNGLKDNVRLVGGSNVTIVPGGDSVIINSTAGSGGLTGSGENKYVPLFTGPSTLTKSAIYQTGNIVGIGTTNPEDKLTVVDGDLLANICYNDTTSSAPQTILTAGVVGLNKNYSIGYLGYRITPNTNPLDKGDCYGVTGYSYGGTKDYGVWGNANGTGINYGIYGTATGGTTNWAGYFDGDIYVKGKIKAHPTEDANLVPIAFGTIGPSGTKYRGSTDNFTVTRNETGQYSIFINGGFYYEDYVVSCSVYSGEPTFITYFNVPSGHLVIRIFNGAGVMTDKGFNFIVYKK